MTSLWEQFDGDADQILEAMVRGDGDRKLQAMTTIIVSRRTMHIRQEMKALKSQYKEAGEEECIG